MHEWKLLSGGQRFTLGEGPLWSARRNAVLWVDIFGQSIHQLSLADGNITDWQLPERIGFIAEERGRETLLAGLKSGIARITLDPLRIEHLIAPEPDRPQNRLNDGKVDAHGNLWFGSKDDDDNVASGALYRLDPDLTLTRQDDKYVCTNGPAFSVDGRTMWHNDSGKGIVYAYDLDPAGNTRNRRDLIHIPPDQGLPDGMTVDAENHLWIAHWDGARISRFSPTGELVRTIQLPASRITSAAFGGENLDRLFVTSARWGREDEPLAGALFELNAGVKGMAAMQFGNRE